MKHKFILPDEAEDAAINAGIAADGDTYELTETEFSRLRPMRGRPRSGPPKTRITIRLSPDVLEQFRAGGRGWQTQIDLALRDWLRTNRPQ